MIKKRLTAVSAICFFVAAVIFFAVVKNTALGICCLSLGASALVRLSVMNKKDSNEIKNQ